MAKVDLRKTVYNKDQFSRVVGGREFTTFGVEAAADEFTVQDFFQEYENLFLSIPIRGASSSHEYLVRKSGELVGFQRTTEDIQPLLDEIASLREQLLAIQQENIDLQVGDVNETKLQDQFTQILAQLAEPPPPFPEIILPDVIINEGDTDITINQGDTNISIGSGGYVLEGDTIDASILGTIPIAGKINVFDNDNIPENVKLTLVGIERSPEYGTAVVEGKAGTISYLPNSNAPSGEGADSFSYRVVDANGEGNIAEVTVNITKKSNEPPKVETQIINVYVATNKDITTQATKLLSTASDPEGEALTYGGIKDKPKYGRIEVMDSTQGIVRYIPSIEIPSGNEVDRFTFTVSDAIGQTSVGTVVVNADNRYSTFATAGADIININFRLKDDFEQGDDANQGYIKDEDYTAELTKNLLENDIGANIRFNKIETGPTYGTLQVSNDGIATYTPRLGVGSDGIINLNAFTTEGSNETKVTQDTFSYSIINERGSVDTATVTINFKVIPPGERPLNTEGQNPCDIINDGINPANITDTNLKNMTTLKCDDDTYDWSEVLKKWEKRGGNTNGTDTCYKRDLPGETVGDEANCNGEVYVWDGYNWNKRVYDSP